MTAARTALASRCASSRPILSGKPSPIPLEDCPWCGDALHARVVHAAARRRSRRASCGSCARTSTATSSAIVRCRSSLSTSRSTGGCPRSSSRPSTSSRRSRGSGVGRTARRRGPVRQPRLLRRGGAQAGQAAQRAAAAARSRHPGRAAPDLGPARHDGRPVRDGDRRAVRARSRRACVPAEGRRLDGDGATRAGPDPGAVRPLADTDLPAAGSGPARLVLRSHGARHRRSGAPLRRCRRPGPQPEGGDAQGLARADGCRRAAHTATPAATTTQRTPPTRT